MPHKIIPNADKNPIKIFSIEIPNNNKASPIKLLVPGKAILAKVKKIKKILYQGISLIRPE